MGVHAGSDRLHGYTGGTHRGLRGRLQPGRLRLSGCHPAIASVIGDSNGGGAGPWVSVAGHSLTINALGDQLVNNNAYSGPRASAAPFNQRTITRHYGFGASQGTGSVTIGGVNATVSSW